MQDPQPSGRAISGSSSFAGSLRAWPEVRLLRRGVLLRGQTQPIKLCCGHSPRRMALARYVALGLRHLPRLQGMGRSGRTGRRGRCGGGALGGAGRHWTMTDDEATTFLRAAHARLDFSRTHAEI